MVPLRVTSSVVIYFNILTISDCFCTSGILTTPIFRLNVGDWVVRRGARVSLTLILAGAEALTSALRGGSSGSCEHLTVVGLISFEDVVFIVGIECDSMPAILFNTHLNIAPKHLGKGTEKSFQ